MPPTAEEKKYSIFSRPTNYGPVKTPPEVPKNLFAIVGSHTTGDTSRKSLSESCNAMLGLSYRKQAEPERFWPGSKDEYLEWRKARVKDYFESFPSWKPFIQEWKEMSDEEKAAHPGLPGGSINQEEYFFQKVRKMDADEREDFAKEHAEATQDLSPPAPLDRVQKAGIPNPTVASYLTSTGTSFDIRGAASADQTKVCWHQFNDAYECHLRGLPSSQCMNLLGIASSTCPVRFIDKWLGEISTGKFFGSRNVRKLTHGHGFQKAHGHH